eukprot:CAMPEP_0178746344 /NCGR_PEP_ID=MMETSP0744-20121128/7760_1 /TAXON_ID=913974 /ORGANISM="Nitzschia punctata, Strain CCMP561" /LENGTH=575 /DNA_ID=CAMNT_0020399551 /DNA_START=11 /DNA_END=1738 /DNA_ORIENTATION=+
MTEHTSISAYGPCVYAHVHALYKYQEDYIGELRENIKNGNLSDNLQGVPLHVVLVALEATDNHNDFKALLQTCEAVPEVMKACNFLDGHREIRQIKRKISQKQDLPEEDRMKKRKGKRARKIDKLRSRLHKLEAFMCVSDDSYHRHTSNLPCIQAHTDTAVRESIESVSLSGSVARAICKWAKTLKPGLLEFAMIQNLQDPWRELADKVHFKPSDFSVPYFLTDVYNSEKIPDDCFVAVMRKLQQAPPSEIAQTFAEVAQRYPQIYEAYPSLRLNVNIFRSSETVSTMAKNMPLDTLVWYFEELQSSTNKSTGNILKDRLNEHGAIETLLNNNSKLNAFGKLLERILMFERHGHGEVAGLLTEIAAHRLNMMKEKFHYVRTLNKKIAVFGDKSASMQAAIDAATIFASMACACLDGELSFFDSRLVPSPHNKPSTVKQALEVCRAVRANHCTALAAALWPYYEKRLFVDVIVLVTDEEENMSCNGHRFAALLKMYKETVNPKVALIIIRVGFGDRNFEQSLVRNGITATTVTIDGRRPDLTKFDSLLLEVTAAANVGVTGSTLEDEENDFVMVQP